MPEKFFRTLYHICWYAIATIIILAAVSITLLRLALPDIGEYREDVQIWVSKYMGYPVEIRDINADWEGWIPNLYLDDIRIINEKNSETLIAFKQASITLDLVSSLKQRDFVPHNIKVSGLDLSLIRHADGSVSLVKADAVLDEVQTEAGKNELGQWFRNQKNIDIENVAVRWLDLKNNLQPVQFNNASIIIHSDDDRMQISGSAIADQNLASARLEYALDIQGHLHTTEWSGQLYLYADKVDAEYWSNYFDYDALKFGNTPGELRLWSDWKKARLIQLDGQISYDELSVNNYPLENISGNFRLERNRNDNWLANIDLQEFTTPEGIWPGVSAEIEIPSMKKVMEKRIKAQVNYVKLDDVINIFDRSDILNYSNLMKYVTGGELTNLNVIVDLDGPDNYLWLDTELDHITLDNPDGVYLSGLSGHFSIDNNKGHFYLNSDKTEFRLSGLYDKPLWFYNTLGSFDWEQSDNVFRIRTDTIRGKTTDFDFSLISSLEITPDNEKNIDLLANISPVSIESALDYLPQTKNSNLGKWMKNSILGGRLLNTDMVLRGPLSGFPYENNDGLFQLITQVENTTLDYNPNWPPIDNLNAEIVFRNKSLDIIADSGNVFSSVLSDTTARIPDLTSAQKNVILKGNFNGTIRDCALFISQSPLNTIRSLDIIKNEELSGPLDLELDLDIPLYDKQPEINGNVYLSGNQLDSSHIGVSLTDLNGLVHFTRHTIESKKLKARYFDRVIDLSISRSGNTAKDNVEVNFTGTMDKDFLRKQFNHYFPNSTVMVNDYIEHLSGASTWQANLDISEEEQDKPVENHLNISSDLVGMKVDLPAPLAKEMTASLPVKLSTQLNNDDKKLLDFQIGDIFAARLEYSESGKNIIDALRVNFGGKLEKLTSTKGIRISGLVDEVSLSDWINLIQKNMREQDRGGESRYDDVGVEVVITNLELFNQLFTDVQLEIMKSSDGWQIKVNSSAITGLISIPSDENVIVLDLTHLHLAENENNSEKPEPDLDPGKIPTIHAHVEKVVYGSKDLGEMYLETSRTNQGLSFDELTFTKPDLSINGYGQWVRENNQNISKFTFEINAEKLNSMLSTFEFTDTAIKDGQTNIRLAAQWAGRPVDFSLDNINGQLDMLIEKGQFLDISPKAGRFFGLLSLQTLPRRLALDFTDIFGEGLSFDTIQGIFTIENGNAYTNDLLMTGPSANIAVTGRTGLIDKDYDQIVTVTPQISDSLPVASALFGPIGVGVGAVIYFASELFDSIPDQIDKILQYQYTITGSWENPVVEEIKSKARASG